MSVSSILQTKVADNCNFCLDTRLSKGLEPACVNACRHGALYFGDLNDPQSIISRLLRVKDTVRIRAHLGTDPNLRYVPVTKLRSLSYAGFHYWSIRRRSLAVNRLPYICFSRYFRRCCSYRYLPKSLPRNTSKYSDYESSQRSALLRSFSV